MRRERPSRGWKGAVHYEGRVLTMEDIDEFRLHFSNVEFTSEDTGIPMPVENLRVIIDPETQRIRRIVFGSLRNLKTNCAARSIQDYGNR